MKKPFVYAHRGASEYAPENTMAAFRKGLEMGAHGIELDVQLTRDGFLVVGHDYCLGRTCNGSGILKDYNLEYLKTLDFGSWFSNEFANEKIPLLSEVIDLIKEKNALLNIEIKSTPGFYNAGIEKKTADIIKEFNIFDNTIVSSFNHYSLEKVKKENPRIATAALYSGILTNIWEYADKIGAGAVHPYYRDLVPEMFDGCRENRIQINTWTVNNDSDILAVAALGVDGIITNVPDKVLKILDT